MTVSDLIDMLEDVRIEHGDIDVRIAIQPSWPLFIERVLCVQVYYEDGEGGCLDMFNPQRKRGRCEIEFAWMLEATPGNEKRLLEEIERRYNEGE